MATEEPSPEAWFSERLANSRLYNSSLERRIARLRSSLRDIASGSPGYRSLARTALSKDDDEAARERQASGVSS